MSRIGLYAVDSKISSRRRVGKDLFPNLALMKLSRYHKNLGDEVKVYREERDKDGYYDKVYVGVIFSWSRLALPKEIPKHWEVGGAGVDLKVKLRDDVEYLMPDYGVFGVKKFYGFTTRGCSYRCKFCVVPEKEGDFRVITDNLESCFGVMRYKRFGFEDIVLLDNDILTNLQHFFNIVEQIKRLGLRVDFNQGLDHRRIDEEVCQWLSGLRHHQYRLAFDLVEYEGSVLKAIGLLRKYGLKKNFWYVLVGYNTTIEQDLYRLNLLRENGQLVYVQRYIDYHSGDIKNRDRLLIPLAQWANQPWIFKSYTWEKFINDPCKKTYKDLYEERGLPIK